MIKKVRTPNTLCPRRYITITCLHKSAGWSVDNCLNLDSADESDKNRYAKNLIHPFNLNNRGSDSIKKLSIKIIAFKQVSYIKCI